MNIDEIKKTKNHLISYGLRPRTIKKYMYYLKDLTMPVNQDSVNQLIVLHNNNVCRAALKQYLLFRNKHRLANSVSFIPYKQKPKKLGLSNEEFDKLLEQLDPREKLIVVILRITGFRVSEVLGDEDIEKGIRLSYIQGNELTLKVKGGRWDPSELPSWLLKSIKDYAHNNALKDDERLFNINANWLWKILNEASISAGIRHVHPHLLKHTTARDCQAAGMDIDETRIILHHLKADTTSLHYRHTNKTALWKAKNRLVGEIKL